MWRFFCHDLSPFDDSDVYVTLVIVAFPGYHHLYFCMEHFRIFLQINKKIFDFIKIIDLGELKGVSITAYTAAYEHNHCVLMLYVLCVTLWLLMVGYFHFFPVRCHIVVFSGMFLSSTVIILLGKKEIVLCFSSACLSLSVFFLLMSLVSYMV